MWCKSLAFDAQIFGDAVNSKIRHETLAAWRSCLGIKDILLPIGLTLLAGCAHMPWSQQVKTPAERPSTSPAAQTTPVPTARPRRPVKEVADSRDNKEPERVAAVDPKSLIGLAPTAVERLLGSPNNVSKNAPSLVWTYTGQGCSFQIVFYPDIKTESFHALKYSSSAGDESSCIRNILTVKSNGPS